MNETSGTIKINGVWCQSARKVCYRLKEDGYEFAKKSSGRNLFLKWIEQPEIKVKLNGLIQYNACEHWDESYGDYVLDETPYFTEEAYAKILELLTGKTATTTKKILNIPDKIVW